MTRGRQLGTARPMNLRLSVRLEILLLPLTIVSIQGRPIKPLIHVCLSLHAISTRFHTHRFSYPQISFEHAIEWSGVKEGERERRGQILSIVFSRSTTARLASFPNMMRAEGLVGMTIRDCPSSFLFPFRLRISILSVRYDTLGRSEVEDGRVLACGSGRAIDMSYNGLC